MSAFYLSLFVLICLLAQAALAPRISFGHVSPDFVMIVVMIVALYRGAILGAVIGFAVGFLQDLGNPEMLGLNALTKTLLGFAVGRIGAKTVPENAVFLFAILAAVALCHDVVYLTFYHWPDVGSTASMIFVAALPSALYTAVFGVGIDLLATRLGAKAVTFGKKRQH